MELAKLSANLRSPARFVDRHPVTVAPSTSLPEAIALMRRANSPPHSNTTVKASISCALVVDQNQLVGLLSPGDVLNLVAEDGWQTMKVADAMTRNLIVLKESEFTDIFTPYKLFCQHSIDCLPIVDELGQPVGLVSEARIRPEIYSLVEILQQEAVKRPEEQSELLDGKLELEKQVSDRTAQLQQQLGGIKESDRLHHLLAQVSSRICNSLNLEDIVNSTVAEVRELLECDRVLLCQFEDKGGLMVAESAGVGWTKAIGNKVEENCFSDWERAQAFRLNRWICADVTKANLTECHLQLLASYQVKANLVVPIVLETDHQNSTGLWGLLIAHQCSGPRSWQASEVEFLDRLAVQISIALQQAQMLAQRQFVEATLLARDEQLQLTLEFTRIGSWQWHIPTGQLTGNESGFRLMGLAPGTDELNYRVWRDRVHPDDIGRVESALARALETRSDYESEFRLICPDGKLYWVLERGRGLYSETGETVEMAGISIDISDRKHLEIALQTSKSQLSDILNTAAASISSFRVFRDRAWEYEYFSCGHEQIFGYTPEQLMADSKLWLSRVLPEDLENIIYPGYADIFAERPVSLEYRFYHKDGTVRWIATAMSSRHDREADCWIVTSVAIDISDRKNAENALRESEARYRAIVEDQSELICRYLRDSKITFVNQAYCHYFGVQSEDLLGNSFMSLIPEADREIIQELYTSLSLENPFFICEHRVILATGEIRIQQWINRAIFDDSGQIVEYQAAGRDVTARKQAEIALQQLNADLELRVQQGTESYDMAVSAGKVGVWNWNLETDEIYIDRSLKALLGYQDAEIPNRVENWISLIHPDDLVAVTAAVNAYLEGVTEIFELEHRMLRQDGSICWLLVRGSAVRSKSGKICRLTGTDTDITDRKLTEEKLQNSEAELLALFNAMTDVVLVFDATGRYLKVAPTVPQLLYKRPPELLGKTLAEIFPEAQANFALHHIRQTLASGKTHRVEYSMEIEGKLIWFDASISPLGVDRVIWVARDITARKHAEAALQKSEEKFRNLFDDAPIAIGLASVRDYRIIKVNEAHRQMLGYSNAELANLTFTEITHPEDVQADIEQVKQLVEGNISRFQMEKRLIKKNGELMWANLTVTLIRDGEGIPLYSMGAIEDISYRKRAEMELQQLKERLHFLLASNPAVIFTAAPGRDFCTTYISDNVKSIVGYDPQELLADANFWSSRIHPEDRPQFLVNFSDLSEGKNCICEYRFLHRDGLYRWLRTELKLLVDSKGFPIEIIGYAADISNSKYAEIARRQQFEQERLVEAIALRLRQSLQLEEILNTTVAELQQVLLADRVLVYQILPSIGGRVIAEAVAEGCSPLVDTYFGEEVFPAQSYQLYLQGRICATSERDDPCITPCVVEFMKQIEVRAKLVVPIIQHSQLWGLLIAHQCDRPRDWQEWEINLFQQLVNQLAIAIQQSLLYQQLQAELSDRKQAEANLKNSLKEKEIFLKEIHHRVKNNICVVASLLELQSNTVSDPQTAKMFEECQNRLYSMALIHEKLYRSTNRTQINFGEYLEDLVTNLFHSYNISDSRILLQVIAEPVSLNLETATPCGLIVNELVSNTLKHAFPDGTSGTVSVECYQRGDREIHLFVKDNGIGFPKNLDFRKTNSMGFQVVCTLTEQLEGTLELSRQIGTAFHLRFKELNYSKRF
ncbi:PAS domain-containing protein [Microcoleus sp. herbarium14]|uniref:PAS domain-containing protein n=1 Tax=Microcoleus sp. herbarium14 TaxID=3055439 RepID=UPI002FCF8064